MVNGYGGTWWGNDDYSSRWDSDFMNLVESLNWTLYDFEAVCTADSLTAYMEEKQIDYLLIDRADDYLERKLTILVVVPAYWHMPPLLLCGWCTCWWAAL